MQKIISQDLSGSQTEAEKIAQYSWKEGEIAWLFDSEYIDVFKVKFTGRNWLRGNKWGRAKAYEFKYLEGSGNQDLTIEDTISNISSGIEDEFFTTKKEAVDLGYLLIALTRENAINKFASDSKRLLEYSKNK